MGETPDLRIGHGYDLHRLAPVAPAGAGRPFVLGAVRFDHSSGPVGHSDGDALLHALTDALLGAIAAPDLGALFPDTDPRWEGADSRLFLTAALDRVRAAGFMIMNVDLTIVCERPKIAPRRAEIIASLARLLGCGADRINVKGKTHEGVDAIGLGQAIEAHAVVLLARAEPR